MQIPEDEPDPDPQPDPDQDPDPPPDPPIDPNNHAMDPANLPRYFRHFDENDVEPINLGRMDIECPDCGALHWEAEKLSTSRAGVPRFGTCCLQGKVVLPPVQAPPRDLLHLFNGVSPHSQHFLKNIRRYNAAFALASIGVKVDQSVQDGHGPYVFKIQGQLFHHVGALLPQPGRNPVYAQLYFYSTAEANRYRLNRRENAAHNHMDGLDPQVMGILDTVLRENHALVRQFNTAFERLRLQADQHPDVPTELRAVIRLETGTDPRRYNAPTADDVAVILPGDGSIVPDSRDLVLQYRGGGLKRIYETNASYQPSVYVLLFPHGEHGWHPGIPLSIADADQEEEDREDGFHRRQTMSLLEYFAYRLHPRNMDVESNHIFRSKALLQQWIVDGWAATDQRNLNYLRNNQRKLRVDLYKGLADALAADVDLQLGEQGQRFILPSSYTGGSRFMFQIYQDSLAIARFCGKPDWFLTMTADPNSPEILAELLPGQSAVDRPDLVARVFREKVRLLLKYIKAGDFGPFAGVVYTIEFQKRGLPHIHLLIFLKHHVKTAEEIDAVISAEIPDPVEQPILYDLVTRLMIHGPCGDLNENAPCMVDKKCSKGFPKPFQEHTEVAGEGYVKLKRPNNGRSFTNARGHVVDNRWVVSYPKV